MKFLVNLENDYSGCTFVMAGRDIVNRGNFHQVNLFVCKLLWKEILGILIISSGNQGVLLHRPAIAN